MKYIILATFIIATGCNAPQLNKEKDKTDILLEQSDSAIASAECSSAVLDSVTTATTEIVSNKVDALEKKAEQYRAESKRIKVTQVEKVIYKVDTVYIEKKRNFWGREKKSITTKSDSTVNATEKVDSNDY